MRHNNGMQACGQVDVRPTSITDCWVVAIDAELLNDPQISRGVFFGDDFPFRELLPHSRA
jgi:hypothetical protein